MDVMGGFIKITCLLLLQQFLGLFLSLAVGIISFVISAIMFFKNSSDFQALIILFSHFKTIPEKNYS